MLKIGMSSAGRAINEQLFADYARGGIDAMEISPGWDIYKTLNYKLLKEYSEKYNVTLWSMHLPFEATDLSTTDGAWRLCGLEYICEIIKSASEAGIHKFVAHASPELPDDPAVRAAALSLTKDSLNQLADFAAAHDSVICVEDLPRSCLGNCSDEILDILSVNDKLRVCFDTNHLLGEDILQFIDRVGDKIATLHVSDYDFVDECHWMPGVGQIPWDKVYKALLDVGYDGVWMYEIGPVFGDRILTCEDFARNAREIFEGKPLTVIK